MDTYTVDTAEYTKEQYNVLKYILKNQNVSDDILQSRLGTERYCRTTSFLVLHKCIAREQQFSSETGRDEGPLGDWYATDQGVRVRTIILQHKTDFLKKFLLSIFCDIIVAFVTSAIANILFKI